MTLLDRHLSFSEKETMKIAGQFTQKYFQPEKSYLASLAGYSGCRPTLMGSARPAQAALNNKGNNIAPFIPSKICQTFYEAISLMNGISFLTKF